MDPETYSEFGSGFTKLLIKDQTWIVESVLFFIRIWSHPVVTGNRDIGSVIWILMSPISRFQGNINHVPYSDTIQDYLCKVGSGRRWIVRTRRPMPDKTLGCTLHHPVTWCFHLQVEHSILRTSFLVVLAFFLRMGLDWPPKPCCFRSYLKEVSRVKSTKNSRRQDFVFFLKLFRKIRIIKHRPTKRVNCSSCDEKKTS